MQDLLSQAAAIGPSSRGETPAVERPRCSDMLSAVSSARTFESLLHDCLTLQNLQLCTPGTTGLLVWHKDVAQHGVLASVG